MYLARHLIKLSGKWSIFHGHISSDPRTIEGRAEIARGIIFSFVRLLNIKSSERICLFQLSPILSYKYHIFDRF